MKKQKKRKKAKTAFSFKKIEELRKKKTKLVIKKGKKTIKIPLEMRIGLIPSKLKKVFRDPVKKGEFIAMYTVPWIHDTRTIILYNPERGFIGKFQYKKNELEIALLKKPYTGRHLGRAIIEFIKKDVYLHSKKKHKELIGYPLHTTIELWKHLGFKTRIVTETRKGKKTKTIQIFLPIGKHSARKKRVS